MFPHDTTDASNSPAPALPDVSHSASPSSAASPPPECSPGLSPRTCSLDNDVASSHQPSLEHSTPPPRSPAVQHMCTGTESSPTTIPPRSATHLPSPTLPVAVLNMSEIQARAEALEMQTRRDIEATQRLAEQHFEEVRPDARAIRATHACDLCRQRKAKSSSLPVAQYGEEGRLGPTRTAPRSHESRYASMSIPYGLRRNPAPCTTLGFDAAATWEATASTVVQPARDGGDSSAWIAPPPSQQGTQLIRPTPIRVGATFYQEAHRRRSNTEEVEESFHDQLRGDTPPASRSVSASERFTVMPHLARHNIPALPRPLQEAYGAVGVSVSSALSSAWTENIPLLPTVTSSTQRAILHPRPLPTLLDQQYAEDAMSTLRRTERQPSWSIDCIMSEDAVSMEFSYESRSEPVEEQRNRTVGGWVSPVMLQRSRSLGDSWGESTSSGHDAPEGDGQQL
ncbi:hypothetical protein EX895_001166 [Sporisorium graminicola]|uniref:Uncharacterized protein n=1 Tax=Sporisorium graminicola TaxID=280036 RepID=A0A4V6YEQ8_9BASI|nr:hypothetical protein EX895_001166 [Sporisorium graminicola]TKY89869.1 hypothetical protein EX895_001166 [Sporisorium graminicola]